MIGVVTGLVAEARIGRAIGPAMAGGGTAAGAAVVAEALVARGATALLSFGLAGGLDPALEPGSRVVPRRVMAADGTWDTDIPLTGRLGGPTAEAIYAGAAIAVSAADKRAMWAATGASAIDLESAAVAEIAARHARPFAVFRAVCDPAHRALPPAALIALNNNGAVRLPNVLWSILCTPSQLPTLIALAKDARAARKSLALFAIEAGGLGGWLTPPVFP